MGSYISQTDIENVYGTTNVAYWSNLSGAATADTTRIASAISYAEKKIENRFRGSRYTVPFTQSGGAWDAQLVNWIAVFAGAWLYNSRKVRQGDNAGGRTATVNALAKDAEAEIAEILGGQGKLDVGEVYGNSPEAPVVVTRDSG